MAFCYLPSGCICLQKVLLGCDLHLSPLPPYICHCCAQSNLLLSWSGEWTARSETFPVPQRGRKLASQGLGVKTLEGQQGWGELGHLLEMMMTYLVVFWPPCPEGSGWQDQAIAKSGDLYGPQVPVRKWRGREVSGHRVAESTMF